MANAETYRGNTPFFPLQGPRVQRGDDVRIPMDAANVEYPPISKRLTQADEDAVWAQYEAMPPSTDAMEKASNVHGSRRWLVPGVIAAAFVVGIGYAALTNRPMAVSEPTTATAPTTDTSAAALMGGAPMANDPTLSTQSTFESAQPTTVSPQASTPPSANNGATANTVVEPSTAPAARPAKVAPPIATPEPATPAPTYSRGEMPATTLPAPAPVPDAGTITAPTPLPSASDQEPALNLDLAPPSETVPAPGSVPENAQSPQ